MRFQNNLEATTSTARTTDDLEGGDWSNPMRRVHNVDFLAQQRGKIPSHEQDEDRWRHEIPGRDPVTEVRGMGA
jgi:hypothetical protein